MTAPLEKWSFFAEKWFTCVVEARQLHVDKHAFHDAGNMTALPVASFKEIL